MANAINSLFQFLQSVIESQGVQQAIATRESSTTNNTNQSVATLQAIMSGEKSLASVDNQFKIPGTTEEPMVWMGGKNKTAKTTHGAALTGLPGAALANAALKMTGADKNFASYDRAVADPLRWNDKQRQDYMQRASKIVGADITSFSQFQSIWEKAAKMAQMSYFASNGGKSGKLLSIWDAMELMDPASSGLGVARTVTQTSRTINQLSDGGAYAIIKNAARQALGRNPTASEVKQFAARANSIAVHNPTVSRSTVHQDAMGNTSTSTRTKQGAGVDDYQWAAEKKVDTAEAGAYQAATTYYNALLTGLDSVV